VTINEGQWKIETVDGAMVRLRSGRIGLVSIDVKAPVSGGELRLTADAVQLTLRLALDELKTGNFLMQGAARSIVGRNDAHVLTYAGEGLDTGIPWHVTGHAKAGSVDVELTLAITPSGPAADPMAEIDVEGSASMGRVHLPLPGLGTVDDFAFDVDGRFALVRKA
jgi:hypothetical protein